MPLNIKVAAEIDRQVTANPSLAPQAVPVLIGIRALGNATAAIGRLYQEYVAAVDLVAKATKRTELLAAVARIVEQARTLALGIVRQSIEALRTDVGDLRDAAVAATR